MAEWTNENYLVDSTEFFLIESQMTRKLKSPIILDYSNVTRKPKSPDIWNYFINIIYIFILLSNKPIFKVNFYM